MKGLPRQEIHNSCELRLADVHERLRVSYPPEIGRNLILSFKSETPFIALNPVPVLAFSDFASRLSGLQREYLVSSSIMNH